MKKLLMNLVSGEKGILGLISEKTGKISFKRSAAILLIVKVVLPSVEANGLTWMVVTVIGVIMIGVALPEVFKNLNAKDK